jgi:hypothetical protein
MAVSLTEFSSRILLEEVSGTIVYTTSTALGGKQCLPLTDQDAKVKDAGVFPLSGAGRQVIHGRIRCECSLRVPVPANSDVDRIS